MGKTLDLKVLCSLTIFFFMTLAVNSSGSALWLEMASDTETDAVYIFKDRLMDGGVSDTPRAYVTCFPLRGSTTFPFGHILFSVHAIYPTNTHTQNARGSFAGHFAL